MEYFLSRVSSLFPTGYTFRSKSGMKGLKKCDMNR